MSDEAGKSVDPRALLGCWELVSWTRTGADGEVTYPNTPRAMGRIVYHECGLMLAFLMHPDWPSLPKATDDGNMYLSYSGAFKVEGDIVSHQVDSSSSPRFVGLTLQRRIVPHGDQITLETLAAVGRPERDSVHRLTWRRPAAR